MSAPKTGTKRANTSADDSGGASKKPKFEKKWNNNNNQSSSNDGKPYDKKNGGGKSYAAKSGKPSNGNGEPAGKDMFINGQPPASTHREQRALAATRRSLKPNADIILRSKKIWERLRRKSHVPPAERAELVAELFSILDQRVVDFVFKHDSVRVVQCAVKYGSKEQKLGIARELRGRYRELAESRYAKFLVGELVVVDSEVRDFVVEEFRGGVRRLVRGSESGWILDDVYRGAATAQQRGLLLREWYGPSVSLLDGVAGEGELGTTGDLSLILSAKPELRGPVMQHLKETTNQLLQQKKTGFTILHDALWQYLANCTPSGPEERELMDTLRDDDSGDLVRNLAFTASGSQLLCTCLAAGDAKYRRGLLSALKTHIRTLASDPHGSRVLLTAMDVLDDTREVSKTILKELLGRDQPDESLRQQELLGSVNHLTSRIPLLWPFTPAPPSKPAKWLVPADDPLLPFMASIRSRAKETSKKDPQKRRAELVEGISQPLLDFIAAEGSAAALMGGGGYGCQFLTEVLLNAVGEKDAALDAVAALAAPSSDAEAEGESEGGQQVAAEEVLGSPQANRTLKTLIAGGGFDQSRGRVIPVEPPLKFGEKLYAAITSGAGANGNGDGNGAKELVSWATGANSFSILAMLECETLDAGVRGELVGVLKGGRGELEAAAADGKEGKGNVGARKILEVLDGEGGEGGGAGGKQTEEKSAEKKGGKGKKETKEKRKGKA